MTTTTGSSAATAPLTLIRAVSPATSSIIRTSSRVRLSPTRAMSCWPGPGRDAGGVEALADDEQRRDEDDRRVAEPGQRLGQVEDAREVERQGGPDRDEPDRDPVRDERDDDRDAGSRT